MSTFSTVKEMWQWQTTINFIFHFESNQSQNAINENYRQTEKKTSEKKEETTKIKEITIFPSFSNHFWSMICIWAIFSLHNKTVSAHSFQLHSVLWRLLKSRIDHETRHETCCKSIEYNLIVLIIPFFSSSSSFICRHFCVGLFALRSFLVQFVRRCCCCAFCVCSVLLVDRNRKEMKTCVGLPYWRAIELLQALISA